jgi:phage regulator Rha-like protein
MKELVKIQNSLTMSSLEIAELTGKRHDHVLRDIDTMLQDLPPNLGSPINSTTYKDSNGIDRRKYDLPKRECLILVSGYSATLRAKIVDRWLELEEKDHLPRTYLQALERLIESEKEKLRLQSENSKLNTLLDNELGYCSILRAATYAGVHEKEFNWRPLKAMTLKLGLAVKKVPSPRYGYQNLYPIRAFEACYPDIDFDDLKPDVIEDKAHLALV